MATADALFAGFAALALAGFARIYAGVGTGWSRTALWAGLIGAALVEGPMAVGVAVLMGAALYAADRKAPWLAKLGWGWGGLAFAAVIAPWLVAVTVATDGVFWSPEAAIQSGNVWFGAQTLALPLLLFPATALLPAAVWYGWRHRTEPGVRVALAWFIPSALVFELAPDRQIVDAAPLFPALAWLAAAALFEVQTTVIRRIGAGLAFGCGLILAAFCLWLAARFGEGASGVVAGVTAVLFAAAGGVSGLAVLRGWGPERLAWAFGLGAVAHMLLTAALLPMLAPLWPAREVEAALAAHNLDPRQGITIGPVASAGFAEPSLVFSLGPETETGDAPDAAQAISEGRPAIVDQPDDAAFRAALKAAGWRAQAVKVVDGFDYVEGHPVRLTVYRSLEAPLPVGRP